MISFIGFLAAFCTTFSFLPQAIKIIRSKATDGISLTMYIMLTSGTLLWLVYGIVLLDYPIIMANAITFSFAFTILILKLKHS